MMPSLLRLRTILTSPSRDTTCRSRTRIFFVRKREHPPAASLAAWCREHLEAEWEASAAERRERALEGLRAAQAAQEAELPGWFSLRSVPEQRWNLSIQPSTEI